MKNFRFIIFLIPFNVMSQELHKIIEVPLTSIHFRQPSQEEVRSLNFEYQAGIELMFWLSKLEADTLTKDITLNALKAAFDSLNNITEYPIAEYNSVWHATFGLSIVFAEELKREYGWEWVMVENSLKVDVGWSLVSSDKTYGINVDQIFYGRIMKKAPIDVLMFYDSIEQLITSKNNKNGSVLFLQLP